MWAREPVRPSRNSSEHARTPQPPTSLPALSPRRTGGRSPRVAKLAGDPMIDAAPGPSPCRPRQPRAAIPSPVSFAKITPLVLVRIALSGGKESLRYRCTQPHQPGREYSILVTATMRSSAHANLPQRLQTLCCSVIRRKQGAGCGRAGVASAIPCWWAALLRRHLARGLSRVFRYLVTITHVFVSCRTAHIHKPARHHPPLQGISCRLLPLHRPRIQLLSHV